MITEFKFKEFNIFQSPDVFKVNTDSLILGAIASKRNCEKIMDVACGSSIITAMYLSVNKVKEAHLIDINSVAIDLSYKNLEQFKQRFYLYHQSYENFILSEQIDLIVSNPPYFSNSLESEKKINSQNRHNRFLPIESFWKSNSINCSENGVVIIIIPKSEEKLFVSTANNYGFFIKHKLDIIGKEKLEPIRVLLEFSKIPDEINEDLLIVRNVDNTFHSSYKKLLKDFLVIF